MSWTDSDERLLQLKLKQEVALREEEVRRAAKEDFYSYCKYMDPSFFTECKWHLKLKSKYLQQLADGRIKKLAISEPPRAGKSYTVSLFHSWIIGKFPEDSSMRNAYAAELAEKFSYNIRDIVQKDSYRKIFPDVELKSDKRSVTDWAITKARDSTYFCAGVGGPILGKGCKRVATLDDPIKNIEEAMSETVLENKWNWYTSTHLSRLETGCSELQVATRWSKKDIIGRILGESELTKIEDYVFQCKDWVVIIIPALINGKSFCEEIKTTEEYMDLKKITDDFIWEAEYMQNPIEEKGLLFPKINLKRFSMSELSSKTPDGIIGYTDTADKGEDNLCSIIGNRHGEHTYITDVVFTQEGVEITEPLTADLMIRNKCKIMNVESNNGGESFGKNVQKIVKDIAKDLKQTATETAQHKASMLNGYLVYTKATTANKETRILMNAGYIKQYFYFRNDYEPGSDYDKYMRELTSYIKLGKNKHDDAADSTTGLAEYMQNEFYVLPKKDRIPIEELTGYYGEDELLDKGYTKWEVKQYLARGIRPWGNGG